MECSGRTQRKLPAPQRIDLGHGKLRMVRSSTSATINRRCAPCGRDMGNVNLPLLVVLNAQVIHGQAGGAQEPLDRLFRRAHFRAAPFLAQGWAVVGQPLHRQRQTARRGEGFRMGIGQPASTSPSVTSFFSASAAPACIRAGISSEKSSIRRSAMGHSSLEGGGGQPGGTGSPSKCAVPQGLIWCQA